MTKQQVQFLLLKGYNILKDGSPVKVDGDIWEYLASLDEEENVLVLSDLATWRDDDLSEVKFNEKA